MSRERVIFVTLNFVWVLCISALIRIEKRWFLLTLSFYFLPLVLAFYFSRRTDFSLKRNLNFNLRSSVIVGVAGVSLSFLSFILSHALGFLQIHTYPQFMSPELEKYLLEKGITRSDFLTAGIVGGVFLAPAVLMIVAVPSEMGWRAWFLKERGHLRNIYYSPLFWALCFLPLVWAEVLYPAESLPAGFLACFINRFFLGAVLTRIFLLTESAIPPAVFWSAWTGAGSVVEVFSSRFSSAVAGNQGMVGSAVLFLFMIFLKGLSLRQK